MHSFKNCIFVLKEPLKSGTQLRYVVAIAAMKRRGAQGAPQAAASTATKQRRLTARKDLPKVVNDLRKSGPYFIGWYSFFFIVNLVYFVSKVYTEIT